MDNVPADQNILASSKSIHLIDIRSSAHVWVVSGLFICLNIQRIWLFKLTNLRLVVGQGAVLAEAVLHWARRWSPRGIDHWLLRKIGTHLKHANILKQRIHNRLLTRGDLLWIRNQVQHNLKWWKKWLNRKYTATNYRGDQVLESNGFPGDRLHRNHFLAEYSSETYDLNTL